ncbi:MAG: YceI family protein [Candidatus Zambryskibacteria bacterium]|nr:YceI family protein [Candidatus Zambryskibacteria bacterium]
MKNIILSIVVLALVGFGGYKLFGSKEVKAPQDQMATTTPVVADTAPVVAKDTYAIDLSKSTVGWKGSFVSGAKSHTGTIALKQSGGKFENGMITSGTFVLDMSSIKESTGDEKLETHLKSDDFFNAEMYPEAKFELTSLVAATTKDTFTAKGKLTIRDVTKDFSFPVVLTVVEPNMISAVGKITFNRADFNVKYGSSSFFKGLGDKVISDKIELTLNLITMPIEISAPPSSIQ